MCWNMLGISPTNDTRAIKQAYAQRVKQCHPEEDPEGFQRLEKAYRTALQLAKEGKAVASFPQEETELLWELEDEEEEEEEESEEPLFEQFRRQRGRLRPEWEASPQEEEEEEEESEEPLFEQFRQSERARQRQCALDEFVQLIPFTQSRDVYGGMWPKFLLGSFLAEWIGQEDFLRDVLCLLRQQDGHILMYMFGRDIAPSLYQLKERYPSGSPGYRLLASFSPGEYPATLRAKPPFQSEPGHWYWIRSQIQILFKTSMQTMPKSGYWLMFLCSKQMDLVRNDPAFMEKIIDLFLNQKEYDMSLGIALHLEILPFLLLYVRSFDEGHPMRQKEAALWELAARAPRVVLSTKLLKEYTSVLFRDVTGTLLPAFWTVWFHPPAWALYLGDEVFCGDILDVFIKNVAHISKHTAEDYLAPLFLGWIDTYGHESLRSKVMTFLQQSRQSSPDKEIPGREDQRFFRRLEMEEYDVGRLYPAFAWTPSSPKLKPVGRAQSPFGTVTPRPSEKQKKPDNWTMSKETKRLLRAVLIILGVIGVLIAGIIGRSGNRSSQENRYSYSDHEEYYTRYTVPDYDIDSYFPDFDIEIPTLETVVPIDPESVFPEE